MLLMTKISSEKELKREYKKLAMIYHPDKGGSTALMQELNREYQILREKLVVRSHCREEIKIGDKVFVNGTECRVIYVTRFSFIAQGLYNGRTAVFDRETGYAVRSRKFRAQFD